jgi:hypothetical protein
MKTITLILALSLASAATIASAQTAAEYVQRDVNQETRIRDGLQGGRLNTREAAVLQREEGILSRLQARDLKDGKLTDAERAQLNRAENKVSRDISTATHNGVGGNPLSASSQRMQETAQRDINQQQRIENGIKANQLTNRETAALERGQARVDQKEFRAGRDGQMSAAEDKAVNKAQDRQSARIHKLKTNAAQRPG